MKALLALSFFLTAGVVVAHTTAPAEVLAYLNSEQTRDQCGIGRASQIRADLLLVEVEEGWFRLSAERREQLAQDWRVAWRHAIRNGRVAILDSNATPVIHYLPDGRARVAEREQQ